MNHDFFEQPILNSPYEYPARHWQLDQSGQPTTEVVESRRRAEFITPIPKSKKKGKKQSQEALRFDEAEVSTQEQHYERTAQTINEVRRRVDAWRELPNENDWKVTPETARLLRHWRSYEFSNLRPFFCQVEAAETAIWLTEVAPKLGKDEKALLTYLEDANEDANPGMPRLALKLATGAGKTTVMAMLIAWQTINAVRRPNTKKFTKGFLVVTPGLTVKDRLRVLQPNDPYSYYKERELVPQDMLGDLQSAKIVITNYHAFKLREQMDVSKGTRGALEGWRGEEISTIESTGQMLQRVMPELMGMKKIIVLNDEAHHCYQQKPDGDEEGNLKGDEKAEAENNTKAARLWLNGLKSVQEKLGIQRIFDLSATPFFLQGSGYAEGTLFPWTMTDFSLMDAIECGIVKLPRVPVADNSIIKRDDMPMYRVLWDHIGKDMPKGNRSSTKNLDPKKLPTVLCTALEALYGHYKETYDKWLEAKAGVPPCFIIVCNNTASSKLIYDYISGYDITNKDGSSNIVNGKFELFRNYDSYDQPLATPNTLLIDSEQLESGDALDANFRKMADREIERFKQEKIAREGDRKAAENISDQELLREVMNTVGKPGRLGGQIRCVVSVSMLTEGWDANNVTHILGVRAFGTQLLCEQVIGRALRRQSYDLNDDNLFNVEYADVLGIPFDFTAKPVVAPPQSPRPITQIKAVKPDRNDLEITFPRVEGYRVEMPNERITAKFTEDSTYVLTPDKIGPTHVENRGILGKTADLNLAHTKDTRESTIIMTLTKLLLEQKFRNVDDELELHLFGQLKRVVRQWLDNHLDCKGDTYKAQVLLPEIADIAINRINDAINRQNIGENKVRALLDPYNPVGTTATVNFNTSKADLYDTLGPPPKCHINYVVCDSDWEAAFCFVAEHHPKVISYVKNHNLGLEVPYLSGSESRRYRPDFIVRIDDGHGLDDLLNLVVEIKGFRGEDVKDKHAAMETYWVPGVNNLGTYGRWAFVEFGDPYVMEADLTKKIEQEFDELISNITLEVSV